jgi:hypothetical protein
MPTMIRIVALRLVSAALGAACALTPDSFKGAAAPRAEAIVPVRSARPVIGLALGGGGARGLAHIGVLRALRDQGAFVTKDSRLGPLMNGSRSALPWVNWLLVDAARNERNKSVHARTYLPHARCRDYIAAIEQELVAWRVLPSASPELWHW